MPTPLSSLQSVRSVFRSLQFVVVSYWFSLLLSLDTTAIGPHLVRSRSDIPVVVVAVARSPLLSSYFSHPSLHTVTVVGFLEFLHKAGTLGNDRVVIQRRVGCEVVRLDLFHIDSVGHTGHLVDLPAVVQDSR